MVRYLGVKNGTLGTVERVDLIGGAALSIRLDGDERRVAVDIVDRTYPLSEVSEAMHYLQKGRVRGKVVITI